MSAAGKVIAFRPTPAQRVRIAAAAAALEISPGEYARRACEAVTAGRGMLLTPDGDRAEGDKSALTTVRQNGDVRIEYDDEVPSGG